jgi:hypothetical protein
MEPYLKCPFTDIPNTDGIPPCARIARLVGMTGGRVNKGGHEIFELFPESVLPARKQARGTIVA